MNLLRSLVIVFLVLLIVATFINMLSAAFRWIFWLGIGTIIGITVGYYLWRQR